MRVGGLVLALLILSASMPYSFAEDNNTTQEVIQTSTENNEEVTNTVCGNGICETGEDCNSCSSDCCAETVSAVCGNGICETGENCDSCKDDCCPDTAVNSVCGNQVCENNENCDNCQDDCCPKPVSTSVNNEETLNNYKASLSGSSTADVIITKINNCISKVNEGSYYDMYLECKKKEYEIKNELQNKLELNDDEWNKLIDYIMLNTEGTPNYWADQSGVVNVNDDKELIDRKLHLNIGRFEKPEGGKDAWASLSISWNNMGLTDSDREKIKQAEKDYWAYEDSLRKESLKSKLSADYSETGAKVIDSINTVLGKATEFESSGTKETAYELAYTQRISEGTIRGLISELSNEEIIDACKYASLNGPGSPNIWEDEFGNINVYGLKVLESTQRPGLRVELNCWGGDGISDAGINVWVNFDTNALREFKDSIKSGRSDAEKEARKIEVAGQLSQFADSLTISDDNKELAESIVAIINEVYDKTSSFTLSEQNVYSLAYYSTLKEAEVQGIAQSLSCSEIEQVGPYVMLYSQGTPEVWNDEFGEPTLSDWKLIYENDYLRANFNHGCDSFNDMSWMGARVEWSAEVRKDYADAIKKAVNDAQREANALRMKSMVIKARRLYNFTLEQEKIGQLIIDKLTAFKEQVTSFESSPNESSAYSIVYNSILLNAEVEGLSQAYSDDSDLIGKYVLLYGPGAADVWNNEYGEITVGNSLRIYQTDSVDFNFNNWFDERMEKGNFNVWLNLGKLRKAYGEVIKNAEKEAWIKADILRKKSLSLKVIDELESKGVNGQAYVNSLKEYITLFNKFQLKTTTPFELELKRLQVSDSLKGLDKDLIDYVMASDLGANVPPGEVWTDYETGEINMGGWRELVTFNKSIKQPFTGINSWCDDDKCNIELHIDWVNWSNYKKDLDKANELFWRQKRESEIADKLSLITNSRNSYSDNDKNINSQLVSIINSIKELASLNKTPSELQYELLTKEDEIDDLLSQANNESIIRVSIAEVNGFHEYDEWIDNLRGVIVYNSDSFEILVRFEEAYTPFFVEAGSNDYEVSIDIIWKDFKEELTTELNKAFEKYEMESSVKRFNQLLSQRDKLVPENMSELITAKVNEYESGATTMDDLRAYINQFYYTIMGYDNELAYLAAISNNTFPELTPINIAVKTTHVTLELYERDFNYRFGGAARVDKSSVMTGETTRAFNILDQQQQVNIEPALEQLSGRAVVSGEEFEPMAGEEKIKQEPIKEELISGSFNEELDDETRRYIEAAKQSDFDEKSKLINRMQDEKMNSLESRRIVKPSVSSRRLSITGLKPRLKLSIDLTTEEVRRLADNIKNQWNELNNSGMIGDIVYNINNDLDRFPSLQDAIREWGDVTTSIKFRYQNESVFELSFRTEDGYIAWVNYGLSADAGVSIELDFESLMKLKNNWERGLKNAEGPLDVISAMPGMFGDVVNMMINQEIKVSPFSTIFRIPNMMKVLFEAMMQSSGIQL